MRLWDGILHWCIQQMHKSAHVTNKDSDLQFLPPMTVQQTTLEKVQVVEGPLDNVDSGLKGCSGRGT